MGVKGLYSFIKEKGIWSEIDLFKEAEKREDGIELLIDMHAFEYAVLESMWKILDEDLGNYYIRLGLGEYETLYKYLQKVINYLRQRSINLVFYVDGARGSSTYQYKYKLDKWKDSHKSRLKKLDHPLAVCRGDKWGLRPEPGALPVSLGTQFFQTLKECGCEVNQLASGEVDNTIANQLNSRSKAYAIIGNDTDFCIFKNSVFIHVDWFKLPKDLGRGTELTETTELITRFVTQQMLSEELKITDHSQLVEFAILSGNDFTSLELIRLNLKKELGIPERDLHEVAKWVKVQGNVDSHPLIACQQKLVEGIKYSRVFYTLGPLSAEPLGTEGKMTDFIAAGIRDLKYPAKIMAMHNNLYWHSHLLEDTSPGQPSVEAQLEILRRYIYKLLLPEDGKCYVMEYGRTPFEPLVEKKVIPMTTDLPRIDQVRKEDFRQNLDVFHKVMTHQEQDGTMFLQNISCLETKTSFIACVLRYFLIMNRKKNLKLTKDEFKVITAMAFAKKLDVRFYQSLGIRPSVRCVSIGNWFQAVYRYAFNFLGKILMLSDQFPQPKEVFSGMVWTAFYMLRQTGDEVFALVRKRPVKLQHQKKKRVIDERRMVLEGKKDVLSVIMDGYQLPSRPCLNAPPTTVQQQVPVDMQANTNGWTLYRGASAPQGSPRGGHVSTTTSNRFLALSPYPNSP